MALHMNMRKIQLSLEKIFVGKDEAKEAISHLAFETKKVADLVLDIEKRIGALCKEQKRDISLMIQFNEKGIGSFNQGSFIPAVLYFKYANYCNFSFFESKHFQNEDDKEYLRSLVDFQRFTAGLTRFAQEALETSNLDLDQRNFLKNAQGNIDRFIKRWMDKKAISSFGKQSHETSENEKGQQLINNSSWKEIVPLLDLAALFSLDAQQKIQMEKKTFQEVEKLQKEVENLLKKALEKLENPAQSPENRESSLNDSSHHLKGASKQEEVDEVLLLLQEMEQEDKVMKPVPSVKQGSKPW